MRQHRIFMEEKLGRRLLPIEHVHHINGIKSDNRIENLIVLMASDHHKQHSDNTALLVAAAKGRAVMRNNYLLWRSSHWARNWDACVKCKTKLVPHQGCGLCKQCYLSNYKKSILSKKIKELKNPSGGEI